MWFTGNVYYRPGRFAKNLRGYANKIMFGLWRGRKILKTVTHGVGRCPQHPLTCYLWLPSWYADLRILQSVSQVCFIKLTLPRGVCVQGCSPRCGSPLRTGVSCWMRCVSFSSFCIFNFDVAVLLQLSKPKKIVSNLSSFFLVNFETFTFFF